MPVKLPILAFNDVYRVSQRYVPQPGAPTDDASSSSSSASASSSAVGTNGAPSSSAQIREKNCDSGKGKKETNITVSQFAQLVYSQRDQWASRPNGSGKVGQDGEAARKEAGNDGQGHLEEGKEGLVLFAGDVFNPSVESSVTRGSHMVPVMNALKVDCACIGNHDFDFGFPHLTKLLNATSFPWLLSNIVDSSTDTTPSPLRRYYVTERCGVKIGLIGLVEEDWIATIPSWPESFKYRPMKEVAVELSKELRDPEKEGVDIIIALTHCRVPNDITLANGLRATNGQGLENEHGVDLLIGGHDHIYYIGKGATSWEGYPGDREAHGTEKDDGVRLVKSGTDFRDLSSFTLTLSEPHSSPAVRRRTVTSLDGKHHYVLPSSPSSRSMSELVQSLLSSVSSTLQRPVCFSLTPFDARSEVVRTRETGLGNWVADVLMHAYAESLFEKQDSEVRSPKEGGGVKEDAKREDKMQDTDTQSGADAVIICGGTLRGDSQYGPGKITLGDILEILPFEDPVVCLEIDGKGIWDCMESALSKWPAQEGRFPIVSGLRVVWDHDLPPNQRVKSMHLVRPPTKSEEDEDEDGDIVDFVEQEDGTRIEVQKRKAVLGDEIKREEGGRVYRVITREYMAEGYDGFEALKNRKFIVDDESGQIMSSIIRSFLLGSSYIFRHKQLRNSYASHRSSRTSRVIDRARQKTSNSSNPSSVASSPRSSYKPSLYSPLREGAEPLMSPPLSASQKLQMRDAAWAGAGPSSPGGAGSKRHVVSHEWGSIRDAMHVAKNEHLSEVDTLKGHEMRNTPPRKRTGKPLPAGTSGRGEGQAEQVPQTNADASYFVNETSREELQAMEDELAIVSPLVDGRMRDLSQRK